MTDPIADMNIFQTVANWRQKIPRFLHEADYNSGLIYAAKDNSSKSRKGVYKATELN